MKKLMVGLAAVAMSAAVFADVPTWFSAEMSASGSVGGAWSGNPDFTTEADTLTLADVDVASPVTFTADKEVGAATGKVEIASSIYFEAYEEKPDVPAGAKAAVIAFGEGAATNYWVLGVSESTLQWIDTGIAADLENEVNVLITISNANDTVYANYAFGSSSYNATLNAGDFKYACFAGNGKVTNLYGDYTASAPVGPSWDDAQAASDSAKASDVWASIPNALADANAKKLATWAKANNVAFGDAGSIDVEAFLLDCTTVQVPTEKAKFKIISIVQDGANWTVKVTGEKGQDDAYANGYINIKSVKNLFGNPANADMFKAELNVAPMESSK